MAWQRKRSIVDLKRQVFFGLELVAISIGFLILCLFLLFMPPMTYLFPTRGDTDQLFRLLTTILVSRWPLVVVALLAMVFFGVLLSHRLYGPLVCLEHVFQKWIRGDRSARVYFRRFDYLLPVKQVINEFLAGESDRLNRVAELASELQQSSKSAADREKAEEILRLVR